MASCSLRISFERSSTDVLRHVLNASAAALMARRVSPLPELGTVPIFKPDAGLMTSIVLPESAATHSPLMRFACFMNWLDFCNIMFLPVFEGLLLFVSSVKYNPALRKAVRLGQGDAA